MSRFHVCLLVTVAFFTSCRESATPPEPYGTLPAERQVAWQSMERYAFIHFTTNTFTDREWGYGDEGESVFNPTAFNADQIIGTLAKAGFKGAIITAKHHDGFCLWPSEYTEHSVKNSPWKDGSGDVVREISDACKKYGIKFGIYLSPWDRNHADYGNEKYVEYYRNQLRELLTGYGDVFTVWFDGANGGDGYYGGMGGVRNIDRSVYYGWDEITRIVRELQPGAVIFSDAGPDARWIGNEHGHAKDSCWATYTPEPREEETVAVAGTTKYWIGETGTKDGKFWMPAEADVSIRPGWFYHQSQDAQVKSLVQLLDIYFSSVGNGTTLNLNVPPDRTGAINRIDSVRLMEFNNYLDRAFSVNLLSGSKASSGEVRGKYYSPSKSIDGDPGTYWATNDGVTSASIEFRLDRPVTLNCLVLQEYIRLGQRVTRFTVDCMIDGQWENVAEGSTIGYKKIVRMESCLTGRIRVNFEAGACPLISEIGAFDIPAIE